MSQQEKNKKPQTAKAQPKKQDDKKAPKAAPKKK